jgi:hypothetical protein
MTFIDDGKKGGQSAWKKNDALMWEIIQAMGIFIHKPGQSQWNLQTIG